MSEPEAEFTISQWERKKRFAESAVTQSDRLRHRALAAAPDDDPGTPPAAIDVLNSTQWERSEVVVLPAEESAVIARLLHADGAEVSSQRLADGSLAFRTAAIPPWSGLRYRVRAGGESGADSGGRAGSPEGRATLDNGLVRVALDPRSGGITSLRLLADGRELVPAGEIMDEYLYVPGRDPSAAEAGGSASVRLTDSGPLVWTAVVERHAPGTENGLETRVRLFAGSERVEITHRFDKTMTYDPEAVLLRLPVAIEAGETVVSGPFGAWRADTDQAPGANRNYATLERWADLHDEAGGLQFVSVDIPGIQLGSLGTDATVTGWRESTDPAPVLYSYVMNNYWETNYRAGQDGPHELRYTLRPHGAFDEAEAERFALQVAHPLVTRRTGLAAPVPGAPLQVSADRAIVTLLRAHGDGDGLLLRLYNPSDEADSVRVAGPDGSPPASVVRSDPWGGPLPASGVGETAGARGPIVLESREVATFLIEP